MPNQPSPATPPVELPRDVERIRTILFGPQMREYEQRFQALQRDLTRLQQDTERLSEQLTAQDNDQGKKLQSLRNDMQKADSELRDELRQAAQKLTEDKVDRATLGDLFVEIGNHLKQGGSLADLLKALE